MRDAGTSPQDGNARDATSRHGLAIRSDSAWTDVSFGGDYRLTVRVLGSGVVYCRPVGFASGSDAAGAMALTSRVVAEAIEAGQPYVQIEDYGELKGATLEARKTFIDAMTARDSLAAVIFCNASPLLKLSIRLGRHLRRVADRVEIVEDFPRALERAIEVLSDAGIAATDVVGAARTGVTLQLGREVETRTEWRLDLPGLSVRYEVIGGRVLHGIAEGELDAHQVPAIFAMNERVASEAGLPSTETSVLVSLEGLRRATLAGRRAYLEALLRWHARRPIAAVVFYGANWSLRTAVVIGRAVVPFPVRIARDRDEALALLAHSGESRASGEVPETTGRDRVEAYVDDILRVLGSLDWEGSGEHAAAVDLRPDHPLAPVFDAIALIQHDVNELFQERRRAAEALEQSEERYRSILETMVEGYYEVDLTGRMVFCNDALAVMLGYRREDIIGIDNRAYMDEENAKRVFSTFNEVFRTGAPAKTFDWELIRTDGERVAVETSITLQRGSDGKPCGFRGVVRDVTEKVRAAEERRRLEEGLRNAQRLEAIGILAGGVAHNFNNLLMGIQGNASILALSLPPGSPQLERIQRIQELVKGGGRLATQLLGFARSRRSEVRPLDMASLVRRTAETFSLTRKGVEVRLDLAASIPAVRADQGQIEQLLLNLLLNAADAMPDGGTVSIATACLAHDEFPSVAYSPKPGRYIALTVRDTGEGMDEATRRHLFEPFFTTKGPRGTGLGLSTVYGTVKSHGGYIDVSSQPGAGTEFRIYLPATDEAPRADAVDAAAPMRGRGTILVVDDEPEVLEATVLSLQELGYTTLQAASGAQAIETFRNHLAAIDLVVLDVVLPDMRGGKVFDAIRAIRPATRVVVASGYQREGEVEDILRQGGSAFLQKPYTLTQLATEVAAALAREPAG